MEFNFEKTFDYVDSEDDIKILCNFSHYSYETVNIKYHYEYENKQLYFLKQKYCFEEIAKCDNQFNQQVNLLRWVRDTLYPDGLCIPVHPLNAKYILEQTILNKIKSNCWMYAVVLNEIYLSMKFKSKMIRCMPLDLRYNDCHCVVHVFSDYYNKWIIIDPAYSGIYIDNNGIPMNLLELKEAILCKKRFFIPGVDVKKKEHIINYWRKNLFRFQCYETSKFNMVEDTDDNKIITLCPKNLMMNNKVILNEDTGKKLNYIFTSNPDVFWEG